MATPALSQLLTSDFAYPLAVGTLGVYGVLIFAGSKVSSARNAAKVDYPAAYADNALAERDAKAKAFNCAQRAHANTLENLPIFLLTLFHSALYHPKLAAAGGSLWIVGRLFYIQGYSTGSPKARGRGHFAYLSFLPMLFFSGYKAVTSLPVFH
ncbi:hypothetical protein JCM8547_007103 [Rhodosporidiobolus lusitaniae]